MNDIMEFFAIVAIVAVVAGFIGGCLGAVVINFFWNGNQEWTKPSWSLGSYSSSSMKDDRSCRSNRQ